MELNRLEKYAELFLGPQVCSMGLFVYFLC